MISARNLRAALEHGVGLSDLTWHGRVAKKAKVVEKPGKPVMPPKPKTRRPRIADKSVVWEDLEKVLRQNSAHGVQPIHHEKVINPISGLDFRQRVYALGFTVTQFARRHSVSPNVIYEMTHYPAGAILTRYLRMLEHEETLAALADILEQPDLTADEIRARLEKIIDEAAARL